MTLKKQFTRARNRGVSLVSINTSDQFRCAEMISATEAPALAWDSVRGFIPMNKEGSEQSVQLLGGMDPTTISDFPSLCALIYDAALLGVIIIIFNAHKLVDDDRDSLRCIQGIANLRDKLGSQGSTLVLMAPSWVSPVELGSDVLELDDPLPNKEERMSLVSKIVSDAVESSPDMTVTEDDFDAAVRSTKGLSRYVVEQTVALSMKKSGLDHDQLRQRFISAVNATPGLRYEPEPVPMDSIGGLANFKAFAQALSNGRETPEAIVRVDEIEKALSGSSGTSQDSSGTSQGILGALLTWMEEKGASGMIALGPPGSGKSMSSIALGSALNVPTITLDIGALKGSRVGQTEANTRTALKALESLAGNTFWVATCNSEVSLPPELRRRFKQGVWFFDLPTAEERDTIWKLYADEYGRTYGSPPNDTGWTGAEIKACCESAWRLNVSLVEAAQWIVPVSISAAQQIDSLRRNAAGRYIGASNPGPYQYGSLNASSGRTFNLDDEE